MHDVTPARYTVSSRIPRRHGVVGPGRLAVAVRAGRRLTASIQKLRIGAVGSIALVVSGIGHILFHPARVEPNEAGRMVESLTGNAATPAGVPTGFADLMDNFLSVLAKTTTWVE